MSEMSDMSDHREAIATMGGSSAHTFLILFSRGVSDIAICDHSPIISPCRHRSSPLEKCVAPRCNRSGVEDKALRGRSPSRSEEHTSELQSRLHLVCRLLLEKK